MSSIDLTRRGLFGLAGACAVASLAPKMAHAAPSSVSSTDTCKAIVLDDSTGDLAEALVSQERVTVSLNGAPYIESSIGFDESERAVRRIPAGYQYNSTMYLGNIMPWASFAATLIGLGIGSGKVREAYNAIVDLVGNTASVYCAIGIYVNSNAGMSYWVVRFYNDTNYRSMIYWFGYGPFSGSRPA